MTTTDSGYPRPATAPPGTSRDRPFVEFDDDEQIKFLTNLLRKSLRNQNKRIERVTDPFLKAELKAAATRTHDVLVRFVEKEFEIRRKSPPGVGDNQAAHVSH